MKSLALAVALAVLTTGAAAASDLKDGTSDTRDPFTFPKGTVSWTGVYVGVHGGYGNMSHDLGAGLDFGDEGGASAFLNGLNSSGYFGGVDFGADVQRGKIVVGAKFQYDWNALETEAGFGVGDYSYETKITEGDSWAATARLGYLVAPEALLYVLGGYGQTEVQVDILDKSFTHDGWIVGAGAEYAITKNVHFNIEYQHMFGSKEAWIGGDVFSLTDEVDYDKVMAGLKLELNTPIFGQ